MRMNMNIHKSTLLLTALLLAILLATVSALHAARSDTAGPVRFKDPPRTATAGVKTLMVHDIGNVRMTLSNWGEQGNPDATPGYFGFEFPLNSENDFLFSAGLWVGAISAGQRLVSTGTDGDNGTNEFAPTAADYTHYTVDDAGAPRQVTVNIPGRPVEHPYYFRTSKSLSVIRTSSGAEYYFTKGAKEIDDDNDWTPSGDLDGNGAPSANYDGGAGQIGKDDDGDGLVDEELPDGLDNDADGLVDEDTDASADANRDRNCNYDPEPGIDEDPAGDVSSDFIDNDFDGLVDSDDPDFDGDRLPGSPDDDGDGLLDEDGSARGTQEFFCVYDDRDRAQVANADADGHSPLGVMVLQRTYAWGEAYAGAFILMDLVIRNVSPVPLTDVFLALFADPDVAARGESGDPASVDDWNFYDQTNLMMIQGDDSSDADAFGMR